MSPNDSPSHQGAAGAPPSLIAARLRAQRPRAGTMHEVEPILTASGEAFGRSQPVNTQRRRLLGYGVIGAISLTLIAAVGTSSLALARNNVRSVDPSAAAAAAAAPPQSVAEATDSTTSVDSSIAVDEEVAPAETPPANTVYEPSLLPFPAGPPVEIPTTERRATPPAGANTSDIDRWLEMAGWPPYLREEAKRVSWCESRWHPDSINGNARGLFQIWQDMRPRAWGWFWYFGYDPNTWSDPVKNAEIALFVYNLDLMRGLHPWAQWECKP